MTQTEKAKRLIGSDARRATRWYCGSLIALASAVYILLTEATPVASSIFAGAIPGGPLLPWLAVVQLGIAAIAQTLRARAVRSPEGLPTGAPERCSVLAYGLIVAFSSLALLRGPRSGLLIAGYDDLLAAILTSSAVSLLLHMLDLRDLNRSDEATSEPSVPTSPARMQPVRYLEGIAAAAFAAGCIIAEVSG